VSRVDDIFSYHLMRGTRYNNQLWVRTKGWENLAAIWKGFELLFIYQQIFLRKICGLTTVGCKIYSPDLLLPTLIFFPCRWRREVQRESLWWIMCWEIW